MTTVNNSPSTRAGMRAELRSQASLCQTAMPGHGWPAPEGNDVRTQRSRSGLAGRRSNMSEPQEAASESNISGSAADGGVLQLVEVGPVGGGVDHPLDGGDGEGGVALGPGH